MAKRNAGNLLQHFVALRCAEALLAEPNPAAIVTYVDCFSMPPWADEPQKAGEGFIAPVNRFPAKEKAGDKVAATFLAVWRARYTGQPLPTKPADRDYPNTAVLLRAAFPHHTWDMRLHDIKDGSREALRAWGLQQPTGRVSVEDNWKYSSLIRNAPVPAEGPVLVMLDPNQIVAENSPKAADDHCLSANWLRLLTGRHALNLIERPASPANGPAVILLFSYSVREQAVDTAARIVTDHFGPAGWSIEHVRSGPWKKQGGNDTYHAGWVVSCRVNTPLVLPSLQADWDAWFDE